MEILPYSASDVPTDFSASLSPDASMAPVLPRGVTTELISRIAAISTSIFPGPLSFEVANHPENPSYEYVVFDVVARGDYGDYRDRIFAWHDEVDRIAPDNGGMFRLIVHPQP